MAQEQLDLAYQQIKAGQTEQARELLEPLIRANRDNSDAWWLYVHAVDDDIEAKRNALNNVLRIGGAAERQTKAQALLHEMNPAFAPSVTTRTQNQPSGKKNKAMIIGIAIVAFLVCGIGSWIFMQVSVLVNPPENYDYSGVITSDDIGSGYVNTAGDRDGYVYEGRAGERLIISVVSVGAHEPAFAFIYGPDDIFVNISNKVGTEANHTPEFILPSDGRYLIIVRTLMGIGQGEYELRIHSG